MMNKLMDYKTPPKIYCICQGPYHVERTSSRLITEVKQRWARLVVGWVTACESRVPLALFFCHLFLYLFIS